MLVQCRREMWRRDAVDRLARQEPPTGSFCVLRDWEIVVSPDWNPRHAECDMRGLVDRYYDDSPESAYDGIALYLLRNCYCRHHHEWFDAPTLEAVRELSDPDARERERELHRAALMAEIVAWQEASS